ncbi:MAG: Lrp/AsnC family transcriptional regulator [Rhodanobacteraceae bacterium]
MKRQNLDRKTFEPLDNLDRRLITELQASPRLPIAQLGRRVGLSPPAIAERMRRLEESGAVSYHVEVDPRALGYSICAIVRVSPQTRDLKVIPSIAREIPEITECHRITGDDCYFMKVYLRSMDDLEPILDHFTPHGRTTTSIVHSAPLPRRALPLPENDD